MDPLSDVLSLLKPRSYHFGGFEAGGDWSVGFARYVGIKCYAIVSGACWLAVEGVDAPVRLHTGDCFLLPRGLPFRTCSDLALAPMDTSALPPPRNGALGRLNGGGDFSIVGGFFTLDGAHASGLLEVLPPIVHLRSESDRAALRWSIERMREELREERPGGFLVAQHLASMILVQALRLHMGEGGSEAGDGGVGWLFALADPQMRAALAAMHAEPAHRWTLQALAARAGMSRSSFAERFKAKVGTSPMEYLTRWRMLLAGDRLTRTGDSISAIAVSLGYESESAFSTAFKRATGSSPRRYARTPRAPGDSSPPLTAPG